MKKLTQQQTTAALVIGFVIIAGGSFYGGMQYQQSKVPARGSFAQMNGGTGGAGRAGGRGGMANGGFASGSILSKDATSITINMKTGGSKIVLLSDKTQVVKATTGILNDLVVGENVTVTGTANSDGSVTAQSIQIRPDVAPTGTQPAPTTPPSATK